MISDVDAEVRRLVAAQAHLPRDEQREPAAFRYMLQGSPGVDRFRVFHGGCCAVCESAGGLVLDHDHATGQWRGWLCPGCNGAEGKSDHPLLVRYRRIHPASILDLHMPYTGYGWHNGWSLIEHRDRAYDGVRPATPWPPWSPDAAL